MVDPTAEPWVFARVAGEAEQIRQRAALAFGASDNAGVQGLVSELPDFVATAGGSNLLRIAVVGQYNAGKTTLIAALTGRRDLPIGAAVTTDAVTEYAWNGILLCDTPGIHADRPDHDQTAYDLIDRADLLLYVVTDEGFSESLARHFRSIAFDRQRVGEILLIINKISQHDNPIEVVRQKVLQACAPLTEEDDLLLIHIDARNVLDADEEPDPALAAELRRESRIEVLAQAFDSFVAQRGLASRLTSRLHTIVSVLRQAIDFLSTEDPVDRARQELIHQQRRILRQARLSIERQLTLLVSQYLADYRSLGDTLAEAIEPGSDKVLEIRFRELEAEGSTLIEELNLKIETQLKASVEQTNEELERLATGALALHVAALQRDREFARAQGQPSGVPETPGKPRDLSGPRRYVEIAQDVGQRVGEVAQGQRFATTVTVSRAAGSHLHRVVYTIGKFFGHSFKPWEAVKIADQIGKIGTVVSGTLSVLGPVIQHYGQAQEERVARQIQEARAKVRFEYARLTTTLDIRYRQEMEQVLHDTFGEALGRLDDEAEQMRSADVRSGSSLVELETCLAETQRLLNEVKK